MHTSSGRGSVVAVCQNAEPGLPKLVVDAVQFIENYGIAGDYHAGRFVRHRYLAKKDPSQPNLRQVLLVDTSILAEIAGQDIHLEPGMLGENIILDGIAVMTLAIGTQLEIGEALLEVTEVRNPCYQLNEMHPRLLKAVVKKVDGQVRRNAGMMARILTGGRVRPGDPAIVRGEPGGL
ncbi:MOSC domain-containing protein [Chloroflexota bacterium]